MAKWKPTFYRTNGRPGATAPLRKLATKFLENMKHRNEEVGNYANPVYRFQYDDKKFFFQSLPGYDIVHITVPGPEGEEEEPGVADVFSGCWEPRFHISGIFGWFMRWFPSAYELFNSEDDSDPPAPAASVDGASEDLVTPMPPNRWMYSDYNLDRAETPWFKDTGQSVSSLHIHPGHYSGKLRELVQMQLGFGLLPLFGYTASNSNGIRLESLPDDVTRIWLIQISGTNGVVMQILADYSEAKFEASLDLDGLSTPPEIVSMGWFGVQTSYDASRPVYTKAAWDAIPEDEQPDISDVSFQLMDAGTYSSAVDGFSAHGDYGWSFNSTGTSAVMVGLGWNYPPGGGPAENYKSSKFTISINHDTYSATIESTAESAFCMTHRDQVKWPDEIGLLNTGYYWKAQDGGSGTQPSSNYTAPIYAYYNLADEEVVCNWKYVAGTYETKNDGGGGWQNWTEVLACRQGCAGAPTTNFHYGNCSTAQSGTGTFGLEHGFVTAIQGTVPTDNFQGYRVTFAAPQVLVDGLNYLDSQKFNIWYGTELLPYSRKAGLHADTQYNSLEYGTWLMTAENVLVIPSWERLGYYHYRNERTIVSDGQLTHPLQKVLERGQPVRQHGDGAIGEHDCEYNNPCRLPGGNGYNGKRRSDLDTTAQYYWSRASVGTSALAEPIHIACSPNDAEDCFVGDFTLYENSVPPDENPYSKDVTVVEGGLMLPDGSTVGFSDDEINNQSAPFRESSEDFGYQSVISCFDTFSAKYIYSMPNVLLTARKHTADGFPDDFFRRGVLFSGMPYFT